MTTITIERAVLLRALEALRPATAPNGAKRDAAFEDLRAALAAPATAPAQPAWHEAPTVPGNWVLETLAGGLELFEEINQTEIDNETIWPGRWYGPIPEDKQ